MSRVTDLLVDVREKEAVASRRGTKAALAARKRKGAGGEGGGAAGDMTDTDKIVQQLLLDARAFQADLATLGTGVPGSAESCTMADTSLWSGPEHTVGDLTVSATAECEPAEWAGPGP